MGNIKEMNKPSFSRYNKLWVALATALATTGTLLGDGKIDWSEGIVIALSFMGALGVYAVPNRR